MKMMDSATSTTTTTTIADTKGNKRRISSTATVTQPEDEPHPKYRHIRESIRKVRPELYETVDKFKSVCHMS